MSCSRVKSVELTGIGVAALLAGAINDANAISGIGLREHSAYGMGSSFAGIAAGGSLSSLFWNSATMTQMPGIQTEIVATGLFPYAVNTPDAAASTLAALGGTGNTINSALLPSAYGSWQVNPNTWLGLSINAPFGIGTSFPDRWAGRDYAESTSLQMYNATPSLAYWFNNWISVGAGVQIQYANATLTQGIGAADASILSGRGWGFGFTAGITLIPTENLTVGLGYRSAIDQKVNGALLLPAGAAYSPPFSTPGSVNTTLRLPDTVSIGIRYRFAPQWAALGTFEWQNWSRIGTSNVLQPNGSPATVLAGLGGGDVKVPFQFSDGWYAAIGAEYQWSDRLALRGGVGFDRSPISDRVRIPLVPDNDHIGASIGSTYRASKNLVFDLAYSHLFARNTPINVVGGNPWFNGTVSYVGNVYSHLDFVSVSLRYRWDDAVSALARTLRAK